METEFNFGRVQMLLDLTSKLRELGPQYKHINMLAGLELEAFNKAAEDELIHSEDRRR